MGPVGHRHSHDPELGLADQGERATPLAAVVENQWLDLEAVVAVADDPDLPGHRGAFVTLAIAREPHLELASGHAVEAHGARAGVVWGQVLGHLLPRRPSWSSKTLDWWGDRA